MLLEVLVPGKRIISFSKNLRQLGRLVNCCDEPMGKRKLYVVRGLASHLALDTDVVALGAHGGVNAAVVGGLLRVVVLERTRFMYVSS